MRMVLAKWRTLGLRVCGGRAELLTIALDYGYAAHSSMSKTNEYFRSSAVGMTVAWVHSACFDLYARESKNQKSTLCLVV